MSNKGNSKLLIEINPKLEVLRYRQIHFFSYLAAQVCYC